MSSSKQASRTDGPPSRDGLAEARWERAAWVRSNGPARTGRWTLRLGPGAADHGGMFIRYYIELPLPPREVEHAMLDAPAEWLSTVAGEAQRRGDHLLTEVGVGPLGPRLGRRVTIQVGQPVRFPSMTSLPLTWEPVGLEGVLPRLDANIELGP